MRIFSIFFLLGMLSLNFFKTLSNAYLWVIAAGILFLISVYFAWSWRAYRQFFIALIAYLLGFIWMFLAANSYFQTSRSLYGGQEGKKITVLGYVASLPERQHNQTRFEFRLLSDHKVRLTWVHAPENLKVGDFLKLEIKLKNPHSYMNKNGFDYERCLFQQGIHAVGSVVPQGAYKRLEKGHWRYFVHSFRQRLKGEIEKQLDGKQLSGLISGLTVGVRSHISPEQWGIMQATGTNHLMAISGLHIGFIAGLIFFFSSWAWRCIPSFSLRIPAPQFAAIIALGAAVAYSALAGFSLPTQRAVIMVTAFLLSTCLRKQLPAWQGLCFALLLILTLDPLAVLSDSFWLSFCAVGVILYGMGGRLSNNGLWWKWGRTQWVVGLGLMPLTLLFFSQVSIIGLLANAIAIPWVGFLVLPTALFGTLFVLPIPEVGGFFLRLSESLLSGMWAILEWLSALPHMQWQRVITSKECLFTAILGILLLLAPRGTPGRFVGGVGILPLFFVFSPQPKPGELWMTVLDVGQGLSVVVRTQHHTLIYDTGMQYGDEFDMGKAALLPFLKADGIKKIDRLVISHGDRDHIGGARSLLREVPVLTISSSVPEQFASYQSTSCQRGQRWVWDGVIFEFLYPPQNYIKKRINDDSCVLRISHGRHRILLPGDIERAGEQDLLQHYLPEQLKADILVVPHHGSRTSSTPAFVKAVNPQYAVFAAGYRNRYKHPHPMVLERYKSNNSSLFFTFNSGSIYFILNNNLKITAPEQYRFDHGYYWNLE